MGRYWAKIAQISDFTGKLQLGFIMQIWGGEGVAVDGDAEPSTASGGCSEAEHPQRSKKLSKRAARRFFRAPQGGGGRCACGYLWSASVRSTDLFFPIIEGKTIFVSSTAKRQRGLSRGNSSPLTRFCLLLAVQKEAPAGQAYSLCLCKRLRDAEGDHKLAPAG